MEQQDSKVILGATVEMRRDACRRIVAAQRVTDSMVIMDSAAYLSAVKLHKDAERIAARYRGML